MTTAILFRPFALRPDAITPYVDGYFDIPTGQQQIGMYLNYQGGPAITNAVATLSVAPGSGITVLTSASPIGDLHPGVATYVSFLADFSGASVGKPVAQVEVTGNVVGGGPYSSTDSWPLFVMNAEFDTVINNGVYHVEVPEGEMTITWLGQYGGAGNIYSAD